MILDTNTWNHTTVLKLFVLDRNTWLHVSMWKTFKKQPLKNGNINEQWIQFPNCYA